MVPLPETAGDVAPRPFGDTRRELGGVVARTLPLALLKAGKERAREGALDGEKGRADHAALLEIVNGEAQRATANRPWEQSRSTAGVLASRLTVACGMSPRPADWLAIRTGLSVGFLSFSTKGTADPATGWG